MEVQEIPPIGEIDGIPRKESPYDTECIAASTATTLPAQVKLYQNFTSFQVTPGVIAGGTGSVDAKQTDRDTNISGSTGALPQGSRVALLAA